MDQKPIGILLVEDSPSDATLLKQMFARLDKQIWRLSHVERLSDAIDVCSDFNFDVVLLDLSLPDSYGLETVAEFRAAVTSIPIVVLTGNDDEKLALNAVAAGAQDYLLKDQITTQLLVRAIRYAIERGQILKQLHDSEQRFRGIFDQTFQLMGLLTPQGIILEVNQTVLDFSGAKTEDFVGKPLWEIKAWNYSPLTQKWLKTAIANAAIGQFFRHEAKVRGAGNKKVWVDFSLKPLKDELGNVMLLIAEGRNISDRKKAEAEMLKSLAKERELNQLKSQFVSMVSHEFRNPLSTILASASLLYEFSYKMTEEQKKKRYERIKGAINQMLHLLDEILLFGRGEVGKLKYEAEPLDLEFFCRDITETLQLNTNNQHKIIFTSQGECNQVEMDATLLQHIFTNLLSNAIKYSPNGGLIRFDLVCENGIGTFKIQDQGIGIPVKDQQHLFETFHRASNVSGIQGTGLGLAIVKNCVDLHGGQIQVETEEGVGTTFTVKLPLKK